MKQVEIGNQTIPELEFRFKLLNEVVRWLRSDPEMMHDPRAPEAIKRYEAQRAEVVARLRALKVAQMNGDLPEPVEVGLKTASLTAKPVRPGS